MRNETPPSFSSARKWLLSLNVLLSLIAVLAIVLMVNYLAARHFTRVSLSKVVRTELSPLTKRVLESVTNDIRVVIFFDKEQNESLYQAVHSLLKEYRYANSRILVETVDYTRNPAAASLLKAKYKLAQMVDRDLVIFETAPPNAKPGASRQSKIVHRSELVDLDIQPMLKGGEAKPTHFKGELMFTSAIFSLISARPLKAYYVQNHNEHKPDSDDGDRGYSKFAAVLERNNIQGAKLDLSGPSDIPTDCNLLIIAGPNTAFLPAELGKVERYLKGGGRLFILFNYYGLFKDASLGRILSEWGVDVGDNVVTDIPNSFNRADMLISVFGQHPIMKPVVEASLYMILPRSVRRKPQGPAHAGAPEVTELIYTGPRGTVIADFRDGVPYPNPATDIVTNVPLAVAVERGKIKDVNADRGTTRMVVVGDSLFLSNQSIDSAGNSDFAALAINWLLDRSEILGNLGPRPIKEYKTTLTRSQMSTARWLLLLGMPGTVLGLGCLVWMRRRK